MRIRNPDPDLVFGFDKVVSHSKTNLPNSFQFEPTEDANVYEYIIVRSELNFLAEPITSFSEALERLCEAGLVFSYAFTLSTNDSYHKTSIHIVFKMTGEYNIMDDILALKTRYLNEAQIDYNPEL